MKKKTLLVLTLALIIACFMALAVGAVTTYDDFDVDKLVNIEYREDDIVVFGDGFSCPSVYVFKDNSVIGQGNWGKPDGFKNAFDFTYINEKTENSYTFEDVVSFDIPEGVTTIGKYAGAGGKTFKKVSIPATATNLALCIFQGATGLEFCTFEHTADSELKELPAWTFYETGLKAFSMPDCITEMSGQGQFTKCAKLCAVYLSKNLTKIEIEERGSATFDGANKLYFVNEPFVATCEEEIPAKPSVYYFPEPLSFISNHCVFRYCNSLNDVLVFDKNLTSVPSNWTFQNSPANTVVFLGDMETVDGSNWGTKTILFANRADKSASDLATLKGSQKKIYCFAEGNTEHLSNPRKATTIPATCVKNEEVDAVCFCGTAMGKSEVEGTALGHSHTVYIGIVYESFLKDGYVGNKCERCDDVSQGEKADAIFMYYGFSVSTYETKDGYSMTQGFGVNRESLEKYEKSTGKSIEFGVVASGNKSGKAINPFENEKVLAHSFKNDKHTYFEIKVSHITESTLDATIIFCLYARDGENVVFINDGTQSNAVLGNSYTEIGSR